jgi:hypothetical protein
MNDTEAASISRLALSSPIALPLSSRWRKRSPYRVESRSEPSF